MARIYKITAYIVDGNERYSSGEDWLRDALNSTDDVYCPCPAECKTAEFEWDNNLLINCIGCEKSACEKYFAKEQNTDYEKICDDLRSILPRIVDYAELIDSPVPSSYGQHYVYEDSEGYIIEAAIDAIETLQKELKEKDNGRSNDV